jgi:hypothetical protein
MYRNWCRFSPPPSGKAAVSLHSETNTYIRRRFIGNYIQGIVSFLKYVYVSIVLKYAHRSVRRTALKGRNTITQAVAKRRPG